VPVVIDIRYAHGGAYAGIVPRALESEEESAFAKAVLIDRIFEDHNRAGSRIQDERNYFLSI